MSFTIGVNVPLLPTSIALTHANPIFYMVNAFRYGLLGVSGWWGKQFVDAETVHPLLFPNSAGDALWPMNPLLAFGGLGAARLPGVKRLSFGKPVAGLRPVLRTSTPKARLRTTRYRGVDTATMIYDQVPVNDVFRKIDEDTVIGAMDYRGGRRPYFFVLRRNNALPVH